MTPRHFLFALLAALAGPAVAQPQTVCTVTVNSADERDALRRQLPEDRYRFVELVQPGHADWFGDACRAQVHCDVLVVSGHFAGTEFYSSRPASNETLRVDQVQRALCSESCPGVLGNLKEVYLFGCDTLKAEPVRSATPEIVRSLLAAGSNPADAQAAARGLSARYAESSRDLMRRLFADVPVIYGFSSLAPLGRHAGPMLEGFLRGEGGADFGSGHVNNRLVSLFAPSSMVVTSGQAPGEPWADERRATCRLYDERNGLGARLAAWHAILAGPADGVRMDFDRAEAFFGDLGEASGLDPAAALAFAAIGDDTPARDAFLRLARATGDPALRLRMIALGARVGWLTAPQVAQEKAGLARDVIADRGMDFGEVELVCGLDGTLPVDRKALARGLPAMTAPQAAALACLGDPEAHRRVLRAVASDDERDVRVAQAYLRHRSLGEPDALRAVVASVAGMKAGPAQVRALETLARHHLDDRDALLALVELFARTRSLAVQRAIAEVFLRSGREGLDATTVATLRRHRLHEGAAPDIIDTVIGQLAG